MYDYQIYYLNGTFIVKIKYYYLKYPINDFNV